MVQLSSDAITWIVSGGVAVLAVVAFAAAAAAVPSRTAKAPAKAWGGWFWDNSKTKPPYDGEWGNDDYESDEDDMYKAEYGGRRRRRNKARSRTRKRTPLKKLPRRFHPSLKTDP
jgi:hypothetical protein